MIKATQAFFELAIQEVNVVFMKTKLLICL